MTEVIHLTTRGPEDTRKLAGMLVPFLSPGSVLGLEGPLGAGKTCFVQGLAEALNLGSVTSPTYTLIHEYQGTIPVYHVDLYRVGNPREAQLLGLDEYLEGDGITVIEWIDRAPDLLPSSAIRIHFDVGNEEDERTIGIHNAPANISRDDLIST